MILVTLSLAEQHPGSRIKALLKYDIKTRTDDRAMDTFVIIHGFSHVVSISDFSHSNLQGLFLTTDPPLYNADVSSPLDNSDNTSMKEPSTKHFV